ncbi:MAG: TolC family protein [Chitinophaga sp.]|jgi:outer membrane protein|nr:TolC family protein [Chitinophaga sp.]
MKKILIIASTFAFTITLNAQVKTNAELKGFINQSFSYFPKIKEIENTVITSEEKLALTKLNNLPEVNGNASYAFIKPKIVIPINGVDFQFAPVHSVNTLIDGSYTLFDFGRFKANVEKSKDELQISKHNVENAKSQLAYQIAQVYYNIVYIKKAIIIQDSIITFLNDNKKIVENKLKDGDALKIDVLNIETQLNEEQNRKVDLQNTLNKQLILLEYTTGIKQEAGNSFDFDVNLTDATTALSTAQTNNVDFLIAKDKIKQAESDVTVAKTTDKPIVAIKAATGVKNGYVPNVSEMRFNYNAGIGLSIPIYNGGKTKQQVKLAENIVKQNQLAVETLNSNYKKDIQQAMEDVSSNLERIKYTKSQIEDAKYAQRLAATRFQNGVSTNTELTNTATATARIQLTELRYQFQLCLAKIELARLMGYNYWQ